MNDQRSDRLPVDPHTGHGRSGGGHSWMMIACCIPMIVIAVILVATGVVGIGFVLVALVCVTMMALMMRAMDHGEGS
jgi:hypothetical protein